MKNIKRKPVKSRKTVKRTAWFAVCFSLFLAAFGISTVRGFLKPSKGWDMLAYVGSAISWNEGDPELVYRQTLQDIEPIIPEQRYREFTEKNLLSNSAENFAQGLPFYKTKPAYIASVWLLRKLGLTDTYSAATWVTAASFFAVLATLLFLWKPDAMNRGIWLLMLSILCWYGDPPFGILARLSTPDSMATAVIFAAFLALFRMHRPYLSTALMLLSITVRPESVILSLFLAFMLLLTKGSLLPVTWTQSTIMAASSAGLYLLIQKLTGSYGYKTLFYHSFVGRIPNPAEADIHLSWSHYWGALFEGLSHIFTDDRLLPLLLISAVAVFLHFRRTPSGRIYPWILLCGWSHYAVKFLLFPSWNEYRYYAINYILILIACGEMIAPYMKKLLQRKREKIELQ